MKKFINFKPHNNHIFGQGIKYCLFISLGERNINICYWYKPESKPKPIKFEFNDRR